MRTRFTILLIILIQPVVLCQTRLVILGTVHEPTKKFTADSITNILSRLNPDLILRELDSSFFTSDFKLKIKGNSNESIGTENYISEYPTPIRPYEIEGRNEYYRKTNYFATVKESYKKLRSTKKKLTTEQKDIYLKYAELLKESRKIGQRSPFEINQKEVYDLVEKRFHFRNKEVLKIFEARAELKDYKDFYKEMGDFWDRRNRAMTQNIIKYLVRDEFKNQTVVVLTGYPHKYYLLNELIPKQKEYGFTIKEFYELE